MDKQPPPSQEQRQDIDPNIEPDHFRCNYENLDNQVDVEAKFAKYLPKISFNRIDSQNQIIFFNSDFQYYISNKNDKLSQESAKELVPQDFIQLTTEYDIGLTKSTIKNLYKEAIESALLDFDSTRSILKQLESASPQEGEKAKKLMDEFKKLQQKFRETAYIKYRELDAESIQFDHGHPYLTSGEDVDNLIKFSENITHTELIEKSLDDVESFPPLFDFIKLQDEIIRKTLKLQNLIKTVASFSSQSDVDSFTNTNLKGGPITDIAVNYDAKDTTFRINTNSIINKHIIDKLNIRKQQNIYYTEKISDIRLLVPFAKTYNEAVEYLNNESINLNDIKDNAMDQIELAVDLFFMKMELQQQINDSGISLEADDAEEYLAQNERDKLAAFKLLTEIVRIESELPQDNIELNGDKIIVSMIKRQIDEHIQDMHSKRIALWAQEENVTRAHESEKDSVKNLLKKTILSRNDWETKMDEIKFNFINKHEELNKEESKKIQTLWSAYPSSINKDAYDNNSTIYEIIKKQKNTGLPSEIFKDLKAELKNITDQEIPEQIKILIDEYKRLRELLTES